MNALNINTEWLASLDIVGQQIGRTPLVPIRRLFQKPGVEIWAKLEWQQLGGSVKARPAYNIIRRAVEQGLLYPGKTLIDATSGNTGIAYAAVGAAIGLPVTIVAPANMTIARRQMLHAHGAKIIFSSPLEGTDGSQALVRELVAAEPEGYFYADQYSNDANWQAHEAGTAQEIWQQTAGRITHFATGLGTTGSFMGTTRGLKALNPRIQAIELQPDFAMHTLEGWKYLDAAVVIPAIYKSELADGRIEVKVERAHEIIHLAARQEGLLLSPSSAASLAGAIALAETLEKGVVVTLFADNIEKYAELYDEIFA
jgi:S-sulfo-L-cysteine synthase (O-acetyl-L-serine-dependent)